jgi:hypothetical protein
MIIGICGFQSSGKDTTADYLIKEYGFHKLSFASVLKDIVSIMFNWQRDKLEGITKEDREWRETVDPWWSQQLKINMLSPRYVLQYFGTNLFREHFHADIWVKVVENKLHQYKNIVITDCRFTNEINMLIRHGAKIIHIHRNMPAWFDKYKIGIDVEEVKNLHQSEKEWIKCYYDYEIINDGSIEELYMKIKKLNIFHVNI